MRTMGFHWWVCTDMVSDQLMPKRFVYALCAIGAARLISASVGTTVMISDEYLIRMRLFGAIAVSDASFQLVVSEPSRRVGDLFKRLEIYVHTRAICVVFDGKPL